MAVLVETHPRFMDHDAGLGHPESAERLHAVLSGVGDAALGDAVVQVEPRPATREELELVHPAGYLDALSRSAAACVAAMAGADHEAEPQTSGGPGRDVVEEARRRVTGKG